MCAPAGDGLEDSLVSFSIMSNEKGKNLGSSFSRLS